MEQIRCESAVIRLLICIVFLFFIVGCQPNPRYNNEKQWREENGRLKVLTTIAMINDLVSEVGKDYVDTMPLIQGELDPHSYELVKGDDDKFLRADVIFFNGLGLEHGASLRQNLENNPKAIAIADSILKQDPDLILIVDGQYDPHIWMDISLWMRTIDSIVEGLSEKDPEHKLAFQKNGEALRLLMQQADREAYERLQAIPSKKRYLVTTHDAFRYFTRRYLADPGERDWKNRCRAPEGLAPEAQLSVTDLMSILDHIEKYHVSVVFSESNLNQDSLKKLVSASREKGLILRLCTDSLYGDAMGSSSSYLEMINHNINVISEELSKS